MSTTHILAQGVTDGGLVKAAAFVAGGIALAGGAIGAANGNGAVGAATIAGTARQPEAQNRLTSIMFLVVGLTDGLYFINLAFMALFVFSLS
jgi:F-type H+-transporting ATPase subunit c